MPTIQQRFNAFHAENPHVYKLLERYVYEVRRAGFEQYSIKAIFERVRWHIQVETRDRKTTFKLCNDYTSRYVRLLEEKHPEFKGFFIKRRLRSM